MHVNNCKTLLIEIEEETNEGEDPAFLKCGEIIFVIYDAA